MPGIINNPALAMYVAAAVALVVMVGFFWYLWSIDRSVAELRRRVRDLPAAERPEEPLRPQRRVTSNIEANTNSAAAKPFVQEQTNGNTGNA